MQPIILALKKATRDDQEEMRYLESSIKKKTDELQSITEELENLIRRKKKFDEHSKVISDFIAKYETKDQ
jgi:molecular chaperone GrpE (heat shock protein)